jgi:hypothetical protein
MARCRTQAHYNALEFVNIADRSQRMDAKGRYWYGHKNGAKTSARRPLLGASTESARSLSIVCRYGFRGLGYSERERGGVTRTPGPRPRSGVGDEVGCDGGRKCATRNFINHVVKSDLDETLVKSSDRTA